MSLESRLPPRARSLSAEDRFRLEFEQRRRSSLAALSAPAEQGSRALTLVLNRLLVVSALRSTEPASVGPLSATGFESLGCLESLLAVCREHGIALAPEDEALVGRLSFRDAFFDAWLQFLTPWNWRHSTEGAQTTDGLPPSLLGDLFEQSLSRKRLGAYYTAPDVADYICRSTLLPGLLSSLPTESTCVSPDEALTRNLDLPALTQERLAALDAETLHAFYFNRLRRLRVLDPTCGAGAFLSAARDILVPVYETCLRRMEELSGHADFLREPETAGQGRERTAYIHRRILQDHLFGVDLLPEAADTCRLRLLLEYVAATGSPADLPDLRDPIRAGDVLLREPLPCDSFDVVVGNPPYLDYPRRGGAYHGLGYATEGCGNLYALVVERSLGLLHPEGRLGMVLPISAVSVESYRPLAERLFRGVCWISTYSNRPARLFEGVEQRLAILLTGPSTEPRLYASRYQHWYERERPTLFTRLRYCRATRWPPTGMPIKSGDPLAESLFQRLMRHTDRLEDLTGKGDAAVWLHDGPTYWVRALSFAPNEGRRSERSSHYHRIPVRTEDDALALAAVLSSTTFYFFFKMVSNCRDLGRKEWAAFPLDPPPVELWKELAALGGALAARLKETAAVRTRRYPSGPVEYEEYYPARAKPILDQVDRLLGKHYGFTAEELDYLLAYDERYRLGRSGAD